MTTPATTARLRLGRISYINCFPVYGAVDRGIVSMPAELVPGTAAELNEQLAAGTLDVSAVSAVEYARHAAQYHLLPNLAITCDGPVHSVALFAKRPIEALDGATILRTTSSRTSTLLLELLCRHRWGITPRFAPAPAEPRDLAALAGVDHEAVLVIGDAALLLGQQTTYPVFVDLGLAWKEWTGLPFVFAVWAAQRTAPAEPVREIHARLLESRAWGLAHLDELARAAAERTGVPLAVCRSYFDDLDYRLSYRHLAGLTDFFRRLAQDGLVPDGSLSFINAA
ncbi:MAG TPA: menaquinone biosynthesis protein [Gemmatimonadales bacterium]|nr:menaquinone biosynthesis protein [Gemmatimonadales bacterium]